MTQLGILGVIAAAIAAMWSQLQGVFQRLQSVLIVKVSLDHECAMALSFYLEDHAAKSRAPRTSYFSRKLYVRPLRKFRLVAVKGIPKQTTYFLRGRPIMFAVAEEKYTTNTFVSFLRGSLDFEALLEAAMALQAETSDTRYKIIKLSGAETQAKTSKRHDNPDDDDNFGDMRVKFCHWKADDIGAPTNNKPFEGLATTPELEQVRSEAQAWLTGRSWYESRGVPWRYSAFLYGAPGMGKTSFVRAVAQELDLPVYVFDIATMSNQELMEHWDTAMSNTPCIVLLEDIDRAFDEHKALRRPSEYKTLTLDCLLNCISGVDESAGIITMMTANSSDNIDEALLRPGRVDVHVHVSGLNKDGMVQIAGRILAGYPEAAKYVVQSSQVGVSGAVFERRCQEEAVKIFREQEAERRMPRMETLPYGNAGTITTWHNGAE